MLAFEHHRKSGLCRKTILQYETSKQRMVAKRSGRAFNLLVFLAFGTGGASLLAFAQALPADAAAVTEDGSTGSANGLGPSGIVPVLTGYNVSVVSSSVYDSGGGWSSILTPDVAYRFNRHLSVDFATPTYVYFLATVNTGTAALPAYAEEPRYFAMGDSTLAGHVDLGGGNLIYSLTGAVGMPTGNEAYGLGAGKFLYNFNNHFETSFGRFSPDFELGISDASYLLHQRTGRARSFTTTGELAHFQAGSSVDLPFQWSLEADFYEDLPIGSQQVSGSTKGKRGLVGRGNRGKKNQTGQTSTAGTTSSSLAEDNGVNASVDIPLNPHLVVSGVYGYSLRQQDGTAGVSLTFLFRPRAKPVM
ncbi:MAG: hypothetical protein NVSMB62_22260 [Acidobacteriaceae bacterium]